MLEQKHILNDFPTWILYKDPGSIEILYFGRDALES